MNLRYSTILLGKWVLFTLYFSVCFILGTLLSGLANVAADQADASQSGGFSWLLVNSALTVGLLAWLTLKTQWSKGKSMLAIFVLLFFIGSLLPQLDSLFFSDSLNMSAGNVGTIILSGAISALLYVPVSVWGFQYKKTAKLEKDPLLKSHFPYKRIGFLSIIYLVIYYLFGYFVAWQSAELREFYSGTTDLLPFWDHLYITWASSPGLFGLQIIRGLMWSSLAFLAGNMLGNGRNREKVLLVSLLFGLIGIFLLLLPNPYMPETIRKVHFVEVLSSNLLFGGIAGWLLFVWKTKAKAKPE